MTVGELLKLAEYESFELHSDEDGKLVCKSWKNVARYYGCQVYRVKCRNRLSTDGYCFPYLHILVDTFSLDKTEQEELSEEDEIK